MGEIYFRFNKQSGNSEISLSTALCSVHRDRYADQCRCVSTGFTCVCQVTVWKRSIPHESSPYGLVQNGQMLMAKF